MSTDHERIHDCLATIMGYKADRLEEQLGDGYPAFGRRGTAFKGLREMGSLVVLDLAANTLTIDQYLGAFVKNEDGDNRPQDILPARFLTDGIGSEHAVRIHVWRSKNDIGEVIDHSMYDNTPLVFHDDMQMPLIRYNKTNVCVRAVDQIYALSGAGTPYSAFVCEKSQSNIIPNLAIYRLVPRFSTKDGTVTLPSLARRQALQEAAVQGGRDALEVLRLLRDLRLGVPPDRSKGSWLTSDAPVARLALATLTAECDAIRPLLHRLEEDCPDAFACLNKARSLLLPLGGLDDSDWEALFAAACPERAMPLY